MNRKGYQNRVKTMMTIFWVKRLMNKTRILVNSFRTRDMLLIMVGKS